MRALQVTESAVSIWYSGEERPPREQMLGSVRRALEASGFAPWPETKAECFACGEDVLVIARPGHSRREGFFFEDLDGLLAGAAAFAEGECALYAVEDGFILVPARGHARPAAYEFGTPCGVSADWEAHAQEQGLCLERDDAAGFLSRLFGDPAVLP